jgi:hypothetical protein
MNAHGRTPLVCLISASFAVLLGLAGCGERPHARLVAGGGAASFEAPGALLTSLTIHNAGSVRVEDVRVSSIAIAGAALTLPASLPAPLGAVRAGGNTILDANFTSPAAKPDSDYLLTVEGTFRDHGEQFKFSLKQTVRTPPASPGARPAHLGSSPAHKVLGAHFPPQKPSFGPEVNESGLSQPIPTGPFRPLTPSQQSTVKPAPKGAGGGAGVASINFPTNSPLGLTGNTIAEPSGASGGGVVFETANAYAAYSTTGGASFTQINPTTVFDNTADGGFCCDQVVQYAPSIDRFIWVMQYRQSGTTGNNRYRIAVASPASIISSGATAWTYWDITSPQINGATSTNFWFDYPDASIGDNYLYLGADNVQTVPAAGGGTQNNNAGHVVIRIPLSQLQSGSTINFGFTTPSDSSLAWGGHVSQNTGDQVFWAGHNSNSSIRVFNWPEVGSGYSWRDISVGSWPKTSATNLLTSTTPDGNDWLAFGFPGNSVLGLARSSPGQRDQRSLLYLAWSGAVGNGFPQPQVQWISLDINNNFALVSQQQVWNPGYAYSYPAFAVNSQGEIGMSLEWGGGGNYENHVAGFWGDYVVYETTNSAVGTTRFGDYVTIRRNTADPSKFDAFGYGLNQPSPPGSAVPDVHYIVFSR